MTNNEKNEPVPKQTKSQILSDPSATDALLDKPEVDVTDEGRVGNGNSSESEIANERAKSAALAKGKVQNKLWLHRRKCKLFDCFLISSLQSKIDSMNYILKIGGGNVTDLDSASIVAQTVQSIVGDSSLATNAIIFFFHFV